MILELVSSVTAKMTAKKKEKEKMKETTLRLVIGARFVIYEGEFCCKSYEESYYM